MQPCRGAGWFVGGATRSKKLADGVWLTLRHPEVANRDCGECQKWMYEDDGKVKLRRGKPMPRRGPTPCRTKQGCPKGTPENQKSLTRKNQIAWEHYQRCKATGRFPDDPIVARNAAIISAVERAAAEKRLIDGLTLAVLRSRLG